MNWSRYTPWKKARESRKTAYFLNKELRRQSWLLAKSRAKSEEGESQ